jgi:septum site-determining protein MinC
MGNIEPGARVMANGNVVVMGSVKGFIHAGAIGNEKAYVVSNNLNARVLQIAQNIAEAPEDEDYEEEKSIIPEIALVNNGRIVVESYLPKVIK